MIGKLTGVIDSLSEEGLLLDVNGVGYVVHASSKTIGRLGAAGTNASILIETQVREDAIDARYAHGVLTVTVPKAELPVRKSLTTNDRWSSDFAPSR